MNLTELKIALRASESGVLKLQLPDGGYVADHFHVTEVGKVTKEFLDCGGKRRQTETCSLQTLVAGDVDHRLTADKLLQILELSQQLGLDPESAVDLEVQGKTVETYRLAGSSQAPEGLVLELSQKKTECLAEDQCGISPALPVLGDSCCGGSGCC